MKKKEKQEIKMTSIEFNYHLKRVKKSTKSLNAIYQYSLDIMHRHLNYRFGNKTFLEDVPHDVFTRVIIENPPDEYIASPSAYLCRVADNYVISMYRRKDNCTEELTEDVGYVPDYKEGLEFYDIELAKAWDKLDKQSQYIIYMNEFQNYRLNEVADIMGLSYDCVRTKKSRALKHLKQMIRKCKKNKVEV